MHIPYATELLKYLNTVTNADAAQVNQFHVGRWKIINFRLPVQNLFLRAEKSRSVQAKMQCAQWMWAAEPKAPYWPCRVVPQAFGTTKVVCGCLQAISRPQYMAAGLCLFSFPWQIMLWMKSHVQALKKWCCPYLKKWWVRYSFPSTKTQ